MALDLIGGMDDLQLKPRMVRSLVRDRLGGEIRPSDLAAVSSLVKTHGLLSEALPFPSDRKLVEAWKVAVDAWGERMLALVDSHAPNDRWAGICMLDMMCIGCSNDRFMSSYSLWFKKIQPNVQQPSVAQLLKVASCTYFVDLFTRLARFPNLKKDATSLAGKLIQSILQMINEDSTEAVLEGALDLLCALITFFPSSIHRHQDNVEAVLVSKITSRKIEVDMSKKLAYSLALLPRVKGDGDSWFSMIEKILLALNMLLTDVFQGLEEENKSSEIIRLLVPLGKDPPPSLGGQLMLGEASELGTKRLHDFVVPRVSTLIHSCCIMLTNPYPVQVVVPVCPLLAIIARVLTVDGSLHASLLPFTTSLQQELLCSELPTLHLDILELLIAIIKGVRSQLLGHAITIVRLLTEYFRRARLPSLRVKVYSIIQILLDSMGVGGVLYLGQEVISNACADLSDFAGNDSKSSNTHAPKLVNGALVQGSQRKRKHALGSPMELSNGIAVEVQAEKTKEITPISVGIAALRALEALLTVGGSLKSECWRSDVDLLLLNVATSACDVGWAFEGKCTIITEEHTSSRAEFQLAAFKALLASLLSPTHVRPPYLSQGLELFRRGKQETGTELARFCTHALLTLQVLMHPRAFPLIDFPLTKSSTLAEKSDGKRLGVPLFSNGGLESVNDLDDNEFYSTWLENDENIGVDVNNQRIITMDETPEGNHLATNSAAIHEVTEGNQLSRTVDAEMQSFDRDTNNAQLNENPGNQDVVLTSDTGARVHPDASKSLGIDLASNGAALSKGDNVSTGGSDSRKDDDASKELTLITEGNEMEFSDGSKMLTLNKGKEIAFSHGSDSDMDSLPDIVDADPDSD